MIFLRPFQRFREKGKVRILLYCYFFLGRKPAKLLLRMGQRSLFPLSDTNFLPCF